MLKILITGSEGQLGNEIRVASAFYPEYHLVFTDIAELDITNPGQVEDFIAYHNVDVIINCAAYTAVDRAEDEPEKAMLVNRDAVAVLVEACRKHDIFLVHISTDYVFDGTGRAPYKESDITSPSSAYGRSKLAGEDLALKCIEKGMVIRTSWLYSSFGANFVKTIIKKGAESGKLNVVDDQIGCPTYAGDLASAILKILPKAISNQRLEIYNYSNEGICSWFEFAKAVINLAEIQCQVNPVSSAEYPQKAPRPMYSVLDKTKIKEHFGLLIPEWKQSLKICLAAMK